MAQLLPKLRFSSWDIIPVGGSTLMANTSQGNSKTDRELRRLYGLRGTAEGEANGQGQNLVSNTTG